MGINVTLIVVAGNLSGIALITGPQLFLRLSQALAFARCNMYAYSCLCMLFADKPRYQALWLAEKAELASISIVFLAAVRVQSVLSVA